MTTAAHAAPSNVIWRPNPGPQTRFLASTCAEVLYGGQVGGGKSGALIALPLRWVTHPRLRALVLRRETTQLGDLLDKADALYSKVFPGTKSRQTGAGRVYEFPSGATIRFDHCQHEKDAKRYDGFEFQVVEFDELTHFTRKQYQAIRARIRSPHPGLPRYTRSTTNPGGEGHEWVFGRWGPWLNPEHEAEGLTPRVDAAGHRLPPAAPGEVLWYVPHDGAEEWVPKGTPGALSRTFIPARMADNPHLLRNDPNYATSLQDLDPVRRKQLLEGNWLVKPAAGLYFKRGWFKFLDAAPAQVNGRCRYWDLAASLTGDYAVGCLMSRTTERLRVVENVVRLRGRPGDVRAAVRATAELDGRRVPVWIEQDPGQAGTDQVDSYIKDLAGWTVRGRKKTIDKVTAAGPLSAQAQAGNVALVRASWNEAFIAELEAFPEGDHDDQVDGASGAQAAILSSTPGVARVVDFSLMDM